MLKPTIYIAVAAAALASCAPYPQRIKHAPVMTNAEKVPDNSPLSASARLAPATAADSATQGRALLQQGDDFVAFGDYANALDRYNRASVLTPREPMVEFKIARLLDLQMQGQEAAMRYKRFLHELEIQKINAQGEANAKLAEAIVVAQQRLMVLDRR
jgi:hypothetical protein